MPITYNTNTASVVTFNSNDLDKVTFNGNTVFEKQTSNPYLTFTAMEQFYIEQMLGVVTWDGTLEYSTDTENWTTWDGSEITSSGTGETQHYIYMRGTGNTIITGATDDTGGWSLVTQSYNGEISCDGDIRTLLDYTNPENTTMGTNCFAYLFYTCAELVKAPDLPATTLSTGCYKSMFTNCFILGTVPDLPATVLAPSCYYRMFQGCEGLEVCPKIYATTGDNLAMTEMFYGCLSLNTLPAIKILDFGTMMCARMFKNCSLIKLSETQVGDYQNEYRLPIDGTGTVSTGSVASMFDGTGGTFAGSPVGNTTYYTSNTVIL